MQEFSSEVDAQPAWERGGVRAPHKPLTLLFAIGRAIGGERLVRYADAESQLKELLEQFGPPRRTLHPEQPVWRLSKYAGERTSFWEVTNAEKVRVDGQGNPNITDLRAHASFGLSEGAYELVRANPAWTAFKATRLAEQIVPETLKALLLEAVWLPPDDAGFEPTVMSEPMQDEIAARGRNPATRLSRSPIFARSVLTAYGHACAICSIAPQLSGKVFGLEAAHIRWVNAGGPDRVSNGLCLCRMHHIALDRGAFTVDDSRRVQLSPKLARSPEADHLFWQFDGAPLRMPPKLTHQPTSEALAWHHKEVFRA